MGVPAPRGTSAPLLGLVRERERGGESGAVPRTTEATPPPWWPPPASLQWAEPGAGDTRSRDKDWGPWGQGGSGRSCPAEGAGWEGPQFRSVGSCCWAAWELQYPAEAASRGWRWGGASAASRSPVRPVQLEGCCGAAEGAAPACTVLGALGKGCQHLAGQCPSVSSRSQELMGTAKTQ